MMLNTFLTDDSGAVTVDWVVLTATLVALGLAVMAVLFSAFETQSTEIQVSLARDDIICEEFCDRFAAPAENTDQ
ncbi:MAG: hypothetical protein WBA02_15575 [Jannaschia helgolandensis]|uniref:Flp pilus assembly protein, pilin Flp n=1 Tax=Jannaschia helgolandensis TaxID=188906 RepID=A0A1H7ML49_9RHOB|nr:hypothetical protein SAMN04488526_1978 [Jannaschia helgolandensis]